MSKALIVLGLTLAGLLPGTAAAETRSCDAPDILVTRDTRIYCLIGIYAAEAEFWLTWIPRTIWARQDALSELWPYGVTRITLTGRHFAADAPRRPGPHPGVEHVEGSPAWTGSRYAITGLQFRDSDDLRVRCNPFPVLGVPDALTHVCRINAQGGDLPFEIEVLTGGFWDGGPGWPPVVEAYDADAWQEALDAVDRFLEIAILVQEPA